jgi:hypothetical protein
MSLSTYSYQEENTMSRFFTPYASRTDRRRVDTTVSDEEGKLIERGYRWGPHLFTDLETGTVFQAQGAQCGAGRCFCAAEITRIVTPGSAPLKMFD